MQTAVANTYLSNPSIYSPYGSREVKRTGVAVTYNPDGTRNEIPTFSEYVSLSPDEQANYDLQNKLQQGIGNVALRQLGTVSDALSKPFSTEGLPEAPQYQQDYEQYRQQALGKMRQFYTPELDRQEEAQRTRLANQGVAVGSEAYDREIQNLNRNRNDAELQMYLSAGGEMDRAFGQDQSRIETAENQRAARLQERLMERQVPLNELLAAGNQVQVNSPQFQQFQAGQIRPTDVAGQYNHYDAMRMQAYQAQMQAYQAKMAGLGQLAGAAGGLFRLSDARLKSNIIELARDARGFGWYEYTIGGRREVGVLAQEVAPIVPGAVIEVAGLYLVNYGAL